MFLFEISLQEDHRLGGSNIGSSSSSSSRGGGRHYHGNGGGGQWRPALQSIAEIGT